MEKISKNSLEDKNKKKRVYNSESRNSQAAQTKRSILNSAKHLFEVEGFEFVTIEKLARAAKVSESNIYSLFQSKIGVLRTIMDEAYSFDLLLALVDEGKDKTAEEQLAISAKIARQMYDAERTCMDIFRGTSILAPEFKELEIEREKRRYQRQEETVKALWEQKALSKELSLTKARDILWAFTGRDMYRMFVIDRGWSSQEYENWITELIIKTMCY